MIICNADKSGQVLTISYSGRVEAAEMKDLRETIEALADRLQPGFLLFSDLTSLDGIDLACAPDMGAIMELCSAKGVATVVRVIPDPAKDIGFNLMSLFHYHAPVQIRTYETLAEAVGDLLAEDLAPASDEAPAR